MEGGNIRVRGCIKSCRTKLLEIKDASGKTNGCCCFFFGLVTRLKSSIAQWTDCLDGQFK